MPSVQFNVSASGTTTLVNAPGEGLRIQLLGFAITGYGDVLAKFRDSAGTPVELTAVRVKDGGGMVVEPRADWQWFCTDNKSLDLNLDAAIQVVGSVTYRIDSSGAAFSATVNSLDFSDPLNSGYTGVV